jgi:hypothetical protein
MRKNKEPELGELVEEPEFIEPAEAAKILGLASPGMLTTWRSTKTKNLPYYKCGRRIKYSRADLEKFYKESWIVRVEPWAKNGPSRKVRATEVSNA